MQLVGGRKLSFRWVSHPQGLTSGLAFSQPPKAGNKSDKLQEGHG